MHNLLNNQSHGYLQNMTVSSTNQTMLNGTSGSMDDSLNNSTEDSVSISPATSNYSEEELEEIGRKLIVYYCPFLVLFGTIGNILSIMVFSRKRMNKNTMSVYTRFMAVNDLAALYTGPIYYYLDACCHLDINIVHEVLCRTYKFRVFLFTDVSAYTILCLTTERLISVIVPHRVRLFCPKMTSYYAITATFLIIAGANMPLILWSHIITVYDSSTGTNKSSCEFLPEPSLEQFWFAFDLAKFWVIPISFITISNVLLLVQLYGTRSCNLHCCGEKTDQDGDVAEMSRLANNRKQKSVTLTLIFVSVVFLVCNLPVVIFPVELVVLPTPSAQHLATIVSDLLMFTNNTLNFLLYCACGTRFRRELLAMLCFRKSSFGQYKSNISTITP